MSCFEVHTDCCTGIVNEARWQVFITYKLWILLVRGPLPLPLPLPLLLPFPFPLLLPMLLPLPLFKPRSPELAFFSIVEKG